MNGQQHYRKNTNQRIRNEQERSLYTPSFFVDNIESSSNNRFTGVPRADEVGGEKVEATPSLPIFATSGHPLQFK